MSDAIRNLQAALQRGQAARPRVGGFPYLAEALRQAGVFRNQWALPSCQSMFLTVLGNVVVQGEPLVRGMAEIPAFDPEALVRALRADQAGEATFPEFLAASWKAGVVGYEVDFVVRTVSYYGAAGEVYREDYPAVEL